MYVVFAIFGLIAGIYIAMAMGHVGFGAFAGLLFGIVLARLVKLDRRLRQLESSSQQAKPRPASEWGKPAAAETAYSPEYGEAAHGLQAPAGPAAARDGEPPGEAVLRQSGEDQAQPTVSDEDVEAAGRFPAPGPSLLQVWGGKVTGWLTTGNVPVKVGVIISFIGIAFLLKYAVDRRLLVISLQFRLFAVAVAGIAMALTGWRLRIKKRVYALSLQGGGIGILFLTVFAALRLWQLLPPTLSFVLLVALTVCTGALAVTQNARSLAILGVVGGFLAPVLTSTGQGSHVVLFSYYLVLNVAILGIAWFRAWRGLNLVGWVFTFVIGSLWGYRYYKPELLASTQPFLVLYFLFYQVIAILFALRQPPKTLGYVDVALVFGTPVVAFALQAALVQGIEYALAYSAFIVAVFYALVTAWLRFRKGESLRLLIESYLALAVVFATIAIPLAFDARWTSAAWSVEGAALAWVGSRQRRQLARMAGAVLIGLSGFAFMDDGWKHDLGLPVLNGNVLGGLLISISALFSSRRMETGDETLFIPLFRLASLLLFAWGALWWIVTGWMEINDRVPFIDASGHPFSNHVSLLFLSLSTAVAAWLGDTRQWREMRLATLIYPLLLVLAALIYIGDYDHLLFSLGWLNWPFATLVMVFMLWLLDKHDENLAGAWHFGILLLVTALAAFEASWWIERIASDAWGHAVGLSIAGLMALLTRRFRERPPWPVPLHPGVYRAAGVFLVVAQVALLTVLAVADPGDPSPLPYIPVLNPFDLAMLFAVLTVVRILPLWGKDEPMQHGYLGVDLLVPERILLSAAFFILTTCALVRGVHHYTGVPWNADALFDSVIVQTSLSVYWGLLGFTGMIWGARRSQRWLWMAGVGFMVLVVVKLFIVDLGNSGTIARIISFIAIGALLLVVGYFAPAPPKAEKPG
jgi:uncharacterized membrane protein